MWPLITGHTHEKMKQTFLEMLQFVKERRSNVSRECAACNPPTMGSLIYMIFGDKENLLKLKQIVVRIVFTQFLQLLYWYED